MEPKRNNQYTIEDINRKVNKGSKLVIYNSKVYDVNEFIADHPGGSEIVKDYVGKDITDIFHDKLSHAHSENAIDILDELYLGNLVDGSNNKVYEASVGKFKETDAELDLRQEKFLDLNQPLLEQMFFNNFTKEFYLEQVHKPRYTKESPRFMSSPFLELFTRTSWYVVPIFWIPVSTIFFRWALHELSLNLALGIFAFGCFLFTLVEYILHRFLFHLDDLLPDVPFFLFAHFLFHGVHHYIPMDRMRLVLPPALAIFFGSILMNLVLLVVPKYHAFALFSGAILGYIGYDLMHYYIHHGIMYTNYFQEMKSYHMAHHHLNYSSGFGITSKIWDYAFGTVLYDTKSSN